MSSDYGDFCREQRKRQQAHRRRQAADAFPFIEKMIGLGFTQAPVGAGFRFSRKDYDTGKMLRIDFWPSTGKWNVVGTPRYETGPRKMIHYAKAHTTKEGKVDTAKPPTPHQSDWEGAPAGKDDPPWN